eukprot:CAMPEP_0180348550 /NCGR_PEP_ID=MMETSP0989-20121125/4991_1 /TAXON_ID=697907 /ORGANISM="non described non described, Strain CCMP2293" /LENGTH=174 /DNA_ID=CAMNT_0022337805 /DNA_START=384 /DNA_END=904 /DNA_ORIENTATION=-
MTLVNAESTPRTTVTLKTMKSCQCSGPSPTAWHSGDIRRHISAPHPATPNSTAASIIAPPAPLPASVQHPLRMPTANPIPMLHSTQNSTSVAPHAAGIGYGVTISVATTKMNQKRESGMIRQTKHAKHPAQATTKELAGPSSCARRPVAPPESPASPPIPPAAAGISSSTAPIA